MQRKTRIYMDREGNSAIIKDLIQGIVELTVIKEESITQEIFSNLDDALLTLIHSLPSVYLIYQFDIYGGQRKQENITNKNSDIFEL